jgi:hypothetical protein
MFTRRHTLLGAMGAALAGRTQAKTAETPPIVEVPIRMSSERLWTSFELAPGEQYVGIFDSGGFVSKVSEQLAYQLNFKRSNGIEVPVEGLAGSEKGRWVRVESPVIGGVFRPPYWWFLTSKTLDRQAFKFLIGASWLTDYNTELDLNAALWRLYSDRSNGPDFAGYTKVPNSYSVDPISNIIRIPAKIGGFSGKFQCDTGSPTNFVLGGRATAALKTWHSDQPYAPWRIGGFGAGRMNTRLYRLPKAEVQALVLDRPMVMLSDPGRSTSIIEGVDGLIGLRAMRNFNMLFDATGKALWLKPNKLDFGNEERYPMSGLWLEPKGEVILVEEVGIGSPAAVAGVVTGDRIVGVEWDRLRAQINGDAGEEVGFQVERGGKRIDVRLTLQPYL